MNLFVAPSGTKCIDKGRAHVKKNERSYATV